MVYCNSPTKAQRRPQFVVIILIVDSWNDGDEIVLELKKQNHLSNVKYNRKTQM